MAGERGRDHAMKNDRQKLILKEKSFFSLFPDLGAAFTIFRFKRAVKVKGKERFFKLRKSCIGLDEISG